MDDELFFAIAEHNLTVVGLDAAYLKPFETSYIMTGPGQTLDVLLTANRPVGRYYMATRQCLTEDGAQVISSNGTAIVEYKGDYNFSSNPIFPHYLPQVVSVNAATRFVSLLRGLADADYYPISVPTNITTRMFIAVSLNVLCKNRTYCDTTGGSDVNLLGSSMNNISWANPDVDVLEAYYRQFLFFQNKLIFINP